MRLVRYAANERVDIPDITAMSFLTLGEFRRTMRMLLTGETSGIVKGFRVAPEAVPSDRIQVELQPAGEERGAAIGAEQTSGGTDYGQLIGDRDSSFITEGASVQYLDFGAQPAGKYIVELRFIYSDGVSDNRAFWDEGTASELVAITDTRHVSSWQIQYAATPTGGQWIPLASVVWGGATIVAGNITDLREFLFEGVYPFTRATQDAAGAVEDFTRSTDRSDGLVTLGRLPEVVRALMRQVQDVKGASTTGVWDWFSRVYRAFDPAAARDVELTKNLRSIDTTTYTIGDGVNTFGDFNGATAVYDCFAHIASIANGSRAEFIDIVIKGSPNANYTWGAPVVISGDTSQSLTIRVRGGDSLDTGAAASTYGRPMVLVNGATLAGLDYALFLNANVSLEMDGVQFTWTGSTAGGRGLLSAAGFVQLHNCTLSMGATPDVAAGYTLRTAKASASRISNCLISGRIAMYDEGAAAIPSEFNRCLIENSRLEATQIVLHADSLVGGIDDMVSGFTMRDCSLVGRGTAPYTVVNGARALFDGGCGQKVSIERCTFSYGINEDCILGRTYNSISPSDWSIVDCAISTGTANGTHTIDLGTGVADGTGWAINIDGLGTHITIDDLRLTVVTNDAGGIRLEDVDSFYIGNVDYTYCGHTTATANDRFEGVLLTGGTTCSNGDLEGLKFHEWLANTENIRCINYDAVVRVTTKGCKFYGYEYNAGPYLSLTATHSVVRIDAVENFTMSECQFEGFNSDDAVDRVITFEGSCDILTFNACHFRNCGRYQMVRTAGTQATVSIDGCTVLADGASTTQCGFNLDAFVRVRANGNSIHFLTGAARDALRVSITDFVAIGNVSTTGNFRNTGVVAGRGYNEAADLNYGFTYV